MKMKRTTVGIVVAILIFGTLLAACASPPEQKDEAPAISKEAFGLGTRDRNGYTTAFVESEASGMVQVDGKNIGHIEAKKTLGLGFSMEGRYTITVVPDDSTLIASTEVIDVNGNRYGYGSSENQKNVSISAKINKAAIVQKESTVEDFEYDATKNGDGIIITKLKKGCTATDIIIPAKIEGLPVKEISALAFHEFTYHYGNRDGILENVYIRKVVIPAGVKLPEPYDIPSSNTEDVGVFADCTSLESVTLPADLREIPRYTFSGCTSLQSFQIPASVEIIGENAFAKSGLTTLTLPRNVKEIGARAFSNTPITELTLSVTSLEITRQTSGSGDIIIYNRTREEAEGNTRIFEKCDSLVKVTITSNLTKLAHRMFADCKILSDVTLPDTLKEISDYAFSGCATLTQIKIPDSVEVIGEYAFDRSGLVSISLPSKITKIRNNAFYGSKIETVEVPAKVQSIRFPAENSERGNNSFMGCPLKVATKAKLNSLGYSEYSGGK
jgi:hypothetical protein